MGTGMLRGLVGLALLIGIGACDGTAESSARIGVNNTSAGSSATTPPSTAVPTTPATGKTSAAPTTRPPDPRSAGPVSGAVSGPAAPSVSLSVARQPTCPVRGTPDAPFSAPGTDVIIQWKVTGASGAAVAVDNPKVYGAYGSYEAAGQLSLAFPCADTEGKTTHTYTVWPAGNKNVSKTISVSAQNNP
ncbi:MAG: hypothetical protein ACJ72N_09180 [Labedaea sp.]